MNCIQARSAIRSVLRRLEMLKANKWTPEDARGQLKNEIIALEMALDKMKKDVAHMLIAIGHKTIIESALDQLGKFKELDRITKTDQDDSDITCLIILEPTEEMQEECIQIFNPSSWRGKNLNPDQRLDYIECTQYFAATDGKNRSLLFDVEVDKESAGKIEELRKWAVAIFRNATWSLIESDQRQP